MSKGDLESVESPREAIPIFRINKEASPTRPTFETGPRCPRVGALLRFSHTARNEKSFMP